MAKDQKDLGRQGDMGQQGGEVGKPGEVGKQGGEIGKQGGDVKPGGMPEKKEWEKGGTTHEPGKTPR